MCSKFLSFFKLRYLFTRLFFSTNIFIIILVDILFFYYYLEVLN